MANASDLRRGRHCVFALHVHLVFVTKYRRHVFTKAMLDTMRPVFESVCQKFEASLVEFDGEDDHVHLLVNYPPKVTLTLLEGRVVVAKFLRGLVRWSAACHHQAIHREPANASVGATRLAPYIPGLKAEALRRPR